MSLTEMFILSPSEDDWEPSEEELKDYWSGEGHLIFTVISHSKEASYNPYEINYDDYSGCVGGLNETLGIDYAVNEGILDVGKLRLGVTYYVEDITVVWTSGDGWTTDDDVDYYVGSVKTKIHLIPFIKAWWWHLIGWRLRYLKYWRNSK